MFWKTFPPPPPFPFLLLSSQVKAQKMRYRWCRQGRKKRKTFADCVFAMNSSFSDFWRRKKFAWKKFLNRKKNHIRWMMCCRADGQKILQFEAKIKPKSHKSSFSIFQTEHLFSLVEIQSNHSSSLTVTFIECCKVGQQLKHAQLSGSARASWTRG